MTRLPAKQAAAVFGLSRQTIHKWAREGRINRYADGYDLAELLDAEAGRDLNALLLRAGRTAEQRHAMTRASDVLADLTHAV